MIAIFKTEAEAVAFEAKVNQHLKDNRPGYNAEKWADIDKSATEELWAVPIPEDYDRWDKKITLDFTIYTYMVDYPEGWHPIPTDLMSQQSLISQLGTGISNGATAVWNGITYIWDSITGWFTK